MGKITIMPYTNKYPMSLMGEAAGYCWGSDTSDPEKNIARAIDCIEHGHGRVSEFGDVYMTIEGYSARVMRELYTHIGGAPTRLQESTRYVKYDGFDYVKPHNMTKDQEDLYCWAMEDIMSSYRALLDAGMKKEDAANILPLGMMSKMVLRINARTLIEMSHQRECSRAYWEFRELFRDIKAALCEYSDEWATLVNNYFMPKCEFFGYCNERKPCKKKFQKLKEEVKNED